MDGNELKIEIEKQRGQSPYSYWTIGITDDPTRRRDEYEEEGKNTKYWNYWKANTEIIALDIENWFLKKGMKGRTSGVTQSTYVYVF